MCGINRVSVKSWDSLVGAGPEPSNAQITLRFGWSALGMHAHALTLPLLPLSYFPLRLTYTCVKLCLICDGGSK